ncbi:MAG TPA: UDP-N-acetylmuramoyl-L-alanine--D-glutamate ligase [Tepidisphaeraceae bacterium]|nr:UDP-N-acetylmuramoyl-L-alanine--D-glutamate ligase [Tepidisphaeraceae bacterium]
MPAPLASQRVTVMGLGHFGGGIAVAKWLVSQGAKVLVTDLAPADKLADSLRQLAGLPIEYRLGEHRPDDFTGADLVVASPAVPLNNMYLAAARAAGVPVTTEICLFAERCPSKLTLGVTGTKGKSTTTSMLADVLRTKYAGRVFVGGNLGKSLLEDLPAIGENDPVVLELSSYMLEHLRALKWSPHVAVVTMIARDHIEWHGSVEAYVAAKRVIVEHQTEDDFAVLNLACRTADDFARHTRAQVKYFDTTSHAPFPLTLAGAHNQFNAQAAYAAASCLGVSWDDAARALRAFRALPHRLELVHEHAGVQFYNDSIATIPEAAVAALKSFPPKRVLQIVGGHLKGEYPLEDLCNTLVERAKAVLCIGEMGPVIAAMLAKSTSQSAPPCYACRDLATAVAEAKKHAIAGDIVLLSTGCKSYDQFPNFEVRGDEFTRLARED